MASEMTARAKIIFDGDCPFCSRYTKYVRLQKAIGHVQLIDARNGGPEVEQAIAKGFNLDDGMVLVIGENHYHGADCLNRLALMSSKSGFFNRLNYLLFRSRTVSKVAYPVLRAGRNLTLRMLGKSQLGY